MAETVFDFLSDLPLNWVVFFASAIPVTELRAAIPFGIASGLSPISAWFWGVLGNLMPIPVIILLWPLIYKICDKIPGIRTLMHKSVDKAREKGKTIEKQGAIGLTLFVGIPLPVTGVWTGSLVSFLLSLSFWKAALSMAIGVMISATIVTLITVGFKFIADTGGIWIALAALAVAIVFIILIYKKTKSSKNS